MVSRVSHITALNYFLSAGIRELSISNLDCRLLIAFAVSYWRMS
uniref:Uncharacterized protein n=1 Tax=Anguilla anguilla TaxID=7936 RepID=A0A0E9PGV6_ANGAN